MDLLFTIVKVPGLDLGGSRIVRRAYRAVVVDGDRILLVRDRLHGELKFPGGGAEPGEYAFAALARETAEETGYRIKSRIRPFGIVREYGLANDGTTVFVNESHYYFCSVHPEPGPQRLSEYEVEYGFEPVWIALDRAIVENEAVPDDPAIAWKRRETEVLKLLLGRKIT
ncbi:MAG: NUDIX domain-containing protein [Candidatus Izemoplasmatales bacterium]